MGCATQVGTLIRGVRTLEEFRGAVEGVRSYVLERNRGEGFSRKLADNVWRERQIVEIFEKIKAGRGFDELVDEPLFKKLVKCKGKNSKHYDYILGTIAPAYLEVLKIEKNSKRVEWVAKLNAAFIDSANLDHQRAIMDKLPKEVADRLITSKKVIGGEVWKKLDEKYFTQSDVHAIIDGFSNLYSGIRKTAPNYFSIKAFINSFNKQEREALILHMQGGAFKLDQVVDARAKDAIEWLAEEFREATRELWLSEHDLPAIAIAVGETAMPTKEQWIDYFTYQYLTLIRRNKGFEAPFLESSSFGLRKLAEDPRVIK